MDFDFPITICNSDEVIQIGSAAEFQSQFGHYRTICAAGGVVIDDGNVLMISRLGKWDFPKGKQEIGESVELTAQREVMEETGLKEVELVKQLPDTWHTYWLNNEPILKRSCWFLMNGDATQPLIPQIEEDIQQVIWVPIAEVENRLKTSYSSLKILWNQVVNLITNEN